MRTALRHKLVQANSPQLLAEEIARFTAEGWCAKGESVAMISAEPGRATYWAQTLDFGNETEQSSEPLFRP